VLNPSGADASKTYAAIRRPGSSICCNKEITSGVELDQ